MSLRILTTEEPPYPNMVPITLLGFRCERCDHQWVPRGRVTRPRVCPKCKSPYWDCPRRNVVGATGEETE